jgi:hypothetical protein
VQSVRSFWLVMQHNKDAPRWQVVPFFGQSRNKLRVQQDTLWHSRVIEEISCREGKVYGTSGGSLQRSHGVVGLVEESPSGRPQCCLWGPLPQWWESHLAWGTLLSAGAGQIGCGAPCCVELCANHCEWVMCKSLDMKPLSSRRRWSWCLLLASTHSESVPCPWPP